MEERNPPRVLLVDDDHDSRELYVQILEWAGFDVQAAEDGEAALVIVSQYAPEAVVLDINLPRRDGIRVLRDLRQLPETAAIPVIALTGYPDAADRARSAGGFSQVLEKPCEPFTLIKAVRRQLDLGLATNG
jgi:CheY-like chemotaxis protein